MFRSFFSALIGFAIVTAAFAAGWIVVISGPGSGDGGSASRRAPVVHQEAAAPAPLDAIEDEAPPPREMTAVARETRRAARPAAPEPVRPPASQRAEQPRTPSPAQAVTELEFQDLARDLAGDRAPSAPEKIPARVVSDADEGASEQAPPPPIDEPEADELLDEPLLDDGGGI